jgi:excisionase family DNA binding protein
LFHGLGFRRVGFACTGLTKILTLPEVASYLRCHPSTIYRLVNQGRIPAWRIDKDWRFDLEAIDRWRLKGGVRQ